MSTRPETGSPDELVWLRGFEDARNQFLAENKRFREALEILAAENSGTCCECWDVKDIARAALEQK